MLLLQLDEEMLAQDLGVTSKLHQKKIMLHVQLRTESTSISHTFSCIISSRGAGQALGKSPDDLVSFASKRLSVPKLIATNSSASISFTICLIEDARL